MALGTVQAGYGNSLCAYSAYFKEESDISYADLLAELTTELELAMKEEEKESVMEEETGADSEQTEPHSNRKKEWEELLEQSVVLEAMLRQMLENGLGQQKEEQQKQSEKKKEEELDNDFDLLGVSVSEEGRHKKELEHSEFPGNSEFLRSKSGGGSEYFSPSAAGRQKPQLHVICLTCEVECDLKKQWKITE